MVKFIKNSLAIILRKWTISPNVSNGTDVGLKTVGVVGISETVFYSPRKMMKLTEEAEEFGFND